MSQKVDGIINSLSELESEIDAVNLSLAEMKKSLNSIAKKEIIINKPAVTEMKTKDSSIFQVVADSYEEKEVEVQIFSDEDISLICQQANVDEEAAKNALQECEGDLARAILLLTTN